MYMSVGQQYLICDEDTQMVNTQLSAIAINSFSFSNPIMAEQSNLEISLTPEASQDFD